MKPLLYLIYFKKFIIHLQLFFNYINCTEPQEMRILLPSFAPQLTSRVTYSNHVTNQFNISHFTPRSLLSGPSQFD